MQQVSQKEIGYKEIKAPKRNTGILEFLEGIQGY